MIKHLVFGILVLFIYQASYAEVIVKADTLSVGGVSNKSADNLTIYAGIAGSTEPTVGDGVSVLNTCTDTTPGVAKACNQSSVYPSLKLTVSFKLTKDVVGAKAKMFIEGTGGTFTELTGSTQTVTATQNSTVITLETTWSILCNTSMGLSADCTGSTVFLGRGLKVGVDANASGDVDDDEKRAIAIKFHYISASDTPVQSYCPTAAAGAGVCNIKFSPGDEKAYIDTAVYAGADSASSSIEWESIAIFPIPVSTGGEATAFTSFANGQATPIFRTINTDGTIPDSSVTGGLRNYQKYCLVYGTRNLAQNIYKFVTDSAASTELAGGCVTPSEVVGVLDDKHCFISTAAFGSAAAPEVEVFRQFRNKFLLTNSLGRSFVKLYYKASPALADVIAGNEFLKAGTRVFLYPFLLFSYMALHFGFFAAAVSLVLLTLLLVGVAVFARKKKILLILALILVSPHLKAEIEPAEETIQRDTSGGLVRIKKDGSYIYDTPRALQRESSRITFGQANQPDITVSIAETDAAGNLTGNSRNFNFQDFYDESTGFILGYDYEWFTSVQNGKMGIQAGFSAMFASGHGKLVASPNPNSTESFIFLTMPLTLGGVYRFEYKDKQMFAPYAAAGGTYVALIEKREDKPAPVFAGGFGFYGSGGVLVNLALFDADIGFQLESEYGISNMWLAFEFKVIESSSEAFTFSNQYLNAGLSFDF